LHSGVLGTVRHVLAVATGRTLRPKARDHFFRGNAVIHVPGFAGTAGTHGKQEERRSACMIKQAIAGITTPEAREATIMTVWPSVAAMSLLGLPLGTMLGRLYAINAGFYIFTVGNVMCLLAIPLALVLYFKRIGPFVGVRYRVTNRRIVVQRGLSGKDERSIPLDQFDTIDVVVHPGQAWYHAGDLIFRMGKVEKFKLEGVSRPEAFRNVCMKAQQGFVGVQNALRRSKPAMA
jgi:membrane protein YdbS with pleckstrin-like domain